MRQTPWTWERSSVQAKKCLLDFMAHSAVWDSRSRWTLWWVNTRKLHTSVILHFNTIRNNTSENTGIQRNSCTAPFSPPPIKCQNTYWTSAVTSEISENRGGHGLKTGRRAIERSRIFETLTPSFMKHPLPKWHFVEEHEPCFSLWSASNSAFV